LTRIWCTSFLLIMASVMATGTAGGVAEVSIEDAWVRAMPPSQRNTAAYMNVINRSETDLYILGASSTTGATVEIHTTREVDGMVRMERVERTLVAPGQTIQFAPGGMHLMILGLEKMPAPGEHLSLCLEIASREAACTVAEVRRAAPSAHDKMHHH